MTNSSSTRPTRTDPTGPSNGISLRVSAADAPMVARSVVSVLQVHGQHGGDDMDLVHVALQEQRPDWSVDLAGRQDGLLARSGLALDEAAGDLAGGVVPLLDIDCQREELLALACLRRVRPP